MREWRALCLLCKTWVKRVGPVGCFSRNISRLLHASPNYISAHSTRTSTAPSCFRACAILSGACMYFGRSMG